MGNDNASSYNNKRSASSVYKLCGDITSYFLLFCNGLRSLLIFQLSSSYNMVIRRKRRRTRRRKNNNIMIHLVCIASKSNINLCCGKRRASRQWSLSSSSSLLTCVCYVTRKIPLISSLEGVSVDSLPPII